MPEYQDYGEECLAEAKRINAEFGTKSWLSDRHPGAEEDYAFAVAAYALYDVLFVNQAYDGMNLVAMEGPLDRFIKTSCCVSANAESELGPLDSPHWARTRSTSRREVELPKHCGRRWRCPPTNAPPAGELAVLWLAAVWRARPSELLAESLEAMECWWVRPPPPPPP